MSMLAAAIYDLFSLLRFSNGRRLFVLQAVAAIASGLGNARLIERLEQALLFERELRKLESDWRRARGKKSKARGRAVDDRWTYRCAARTRRRRSTTCSARARCATRVDAAVADDGEHTPHIARMGLAYNKLNASGEVLPRQANVIHVDDVTPMPAGAPRRTRWASTSRDTPEVIESWRNNLSDHCPVKVWLKL